MKKLLTLLLTLVMAICLINLNNSHTKADEGNKDYTYNYDGSWSSSEEPSYNSADTITIVKTGSKNIVVAIGTDYTWVTKTTEPKTYTVKHNGTAISLASSPMGGTVTITEGPADYTYTYTYNGSTGSWGPEPTQQSYSAGQTIDIVSPSSDEMITISVNGNVAKTLINETYVYTIKNNGATIELDKIEFMEEDAYVTITDTAPTPKPDPSPSEPVVKDESCEKVIGPTWHWNNEKGVCEEYATVGTSTR